MNPMISVPIRYLEDPTTPSGLRRDENQSFQEAIADFLRAAAERGGPVPDSQDVSDRILFVVGNINPNRLAHQTNSPLRNRTLFIEHKDAPPWFGVGTRA